MASRTARTEKDTLQVSTEFLLEEDKNMLNSDGAVGCTFRKLNCALSIGELHDWLVNYVLIKLNKTSDHSG